MARLPKPQLGPSSDSSDSNLLVILGLGVAAIVGLLVITGQGPFGGGSESEEPAAIPAGAGGTTPDAAATAPGAPGPAPAKKTSRKANGEKKAKGSAGADQSQPGKPKGNAKAGTAPPADGSGDATDRYLDCIAKAEGKKEIDRCAELVGG